MFFVVIFFSFESLFHVKTGQMRANNLAIILSVIVLIVAIYATLIECLATIEGGHGRTKRGIYVENSGIGVSERFFIFVLYSMDVNSYI